MLLDGCSKPKRLTATAGPGLRGVGRIPVFWCNRARVSFLASSFLRTTAGVNLIDGQASRFEYAINLLTNRANLGCMRFLHLSIRAGDGAVLAM